MELWLSCRRRFCEAKVRKMDKVNCALYRFTVKLKLRAWFAHRLKQMEDNRPRLMDRHQTRSGWVQGPVAAVHPLLGCIVKDVKGTGDPRGIIDAVGSHRSTWWQQRQNRQSLCLYGAVWPALGRNFQPFKCKKRDEICSCSRGICDPVS